MSEPYAISPPQINFRSPDFNVLDDLDHNHGNYREFESLEGVVTAHMRHMEELHQNRLPPESSQPAPADARPETKGGDDEAAAGEPPPLTVTSRGRTLIIAQELGLGLDCGKQLQDRELPCTICVPIGGGSDFARSRIGPFAVAEVDALSIKGSFGGFTATVTVNGEQANLCALLGDESGAFDLVLDLQSSVSYAGTQLPAGYFAPAGHDGRLAEAMAVLPEMRGQFKKPHFAVLRDHRCYHSRAKTKDCRRCLEICPVGAIRTDEKRITIDPYLCQGCGGCALVCPAEAIRLYAPARTEFLTDLARHLAEAAEMRTSPPALILYDAELDLDRLPGVNEEGGLRPVFHPVEEIARIGLDVILCALACGAGSVTLACSLDRAAAIRGALARQVRLAQTILAGLNLAGDAVRYVELAAEGGAAGLTPAGPVLLRHDGQPIPPARFSFADDARELVRMAAQHLCTPSPVSQPAVQLPGGAPFGAVAIQAQSCTLCMACAGACPAGALVASGDVPRLTLKESACHQCGLCAAACPEGAVRLLPRLLCDVAAAETPVVLREVEPFKCVECGLPFASGAMVARMREKLSGHWMYQSDRQLRRLQMCRTCRTRDALLARDYT